MNNTIITIFVVVAAVAIVVQMAILFALYKAMRETASRMEGIAGRLEKQSTPLIATAQAILEDAQPKLAEITSNLAESTALVRAQVSQVGAATGEIVERARAQAVRMDEFVTGAVSKMETTTQMLHAVVSPARRIHAIVQAVTAGMSVLRSSRSRNKHKQTNSADEEMFI